MLPRPLASISLDVWWLHPCKVQRILDLQRGLFKMSTPSTALYEQLSVVDKTYRPAGPRVISRGEPGNSTSAQ